MAESALDRCRAEEARRPSSWDLLADVYAMLGAGRQAEQWRAQAREQSGWADPAAMADRPLTLSTLENQLLDAIERDDKPAVQTRDGPGLRALPAALPGGGAAGAGSPRRGLGAARGGGLRRPRRRAHLARGGGAGQEGPAHAQRLAERGLGPERGGLAGAAAVLRGARAWVEQRFRPLYLGLEAGHTFLPFAPEAQFQFRSQELEVGAWLRRRRTSSDTRLKGGVRFLGRRRAEPLRPPDPPVPAGAACRCTSSCGPSWASCRCTRRLLRAAAVRDGGEVERRLALPAAGWRPSAHGGGQPLLAARSAPAVDRAGAVRRAGPPLRARILERAAAPVRLAQRPPQPARGVGGGRPARAPRATPTPPRTKRPCGRSSWVTILAPASGPRSATTSESSRKAGARAARIVTVSRAGRRTCCPRLQQGYGIEAHFGFVFARRQELAASAFLYGGWREAVAERYGGASLSYVARWF